MRTEYEINREIAHWEEKDGKKKLDDLFHELRTVQHFNSGFRTYHAVYKMDNYRPSAIFEDWKEAYDYVITSPEYEFGDRTKVELISPEWEEIL